MRYSHVLGAAVVSLAAAMTAQAGMSVSLVGVNNTAASFANGERTFDLKVTTTSGTKWSSADLQFNGIGLANTGNFAGTAFFNLPSGDADIVNLAGAGSAAFDTGMTSPLGGAGVSVLGKAQYPVESGVGAAVFSSTATPTNDIDVAWGDFNANGAVDGTYTIARFTVVGNGGAYLTGRVGATNNSIAPVDFTNLYMPILGDTNADGIVNAVDFTDVLNNLGNPGGVGDTNYDDTVNAIDFTNVLNNLGNDIATVPLPGGTLGAVVPEPTSLGFVGVVAMGFLARRRTR